MMKSIFTFASHRIQQVFASRPLRWVALPVVAFTLAGVAHAQAYVNVTVGGAFAPGVYGQIVMGNNPPPPVLNVQPVVVGRPIYGAPVMYVHSAPDEARDWDRYCYRYGACGRPVYFVEVDRHNRWWDHHNEHLRGEDYYRRPIYRHRGGWDERRGGDEHRDDHRH